MWPRRRWAVASVAIGVAVGVAISSIGLAPGFNPLFHTICVDQGIVSTEAHVWIPVQIINSPYGGRASGEVDLLDGPEVGSSGFVNGEVDWTGVQESLSLHEFTNHTVDGIGASSGCNGRYAIQLESLRSTASGIQLVGPGNQSDAGEPQTLGEEASDNVTFVNGFDASNSPDFSTCGGPNGTISLTSLFLTLTYHTRIDGSPVNVSFLAPITNASFHYWFPANFGSWAIDDLEAAAGPGGGLAFSYLGPCS